MNEQIKRLNKLGRELQEFAPYGRGMWKQLLDVRLEIQRLSTVTLSEDQLERVQEHVEAILVKLESLRRVCDALTVSTHELVLIREE